MSTYKIPKKTKKKKIGKLTLKGNPLAMFYHPIKSFLCVSHPNLGSFIGIAITDIVL